MSGINFPKMTSHVFVCDSQHYMETCFDFSWKIPFQLDENGVFRIEFATNSNWGVGVTFGSLLRLFSKNRKETFLESKESQILELRCHDTKAEAKRGVRSCGICWHLAFARACPSGGATSSVVPCRWMQCGAESETQCRARAQGVVLSEKACFHF